MCCAALEFQQVDSNLPALDNRKGKVIAALEGDECGKFSVEVYTDARQIGYMYLYECIYDVFT